MSSEIAVSKEILESFRSLSEQCESAMIDREQIVAHATLSGWVDHWPSLAEPGLRELLDQTQVIKQMERSRWVVQRRIAIAKLSRQFS